MRVFSGMRICRSGFRWHAVSVALLLALVGCGTDGAAELTSPVGAAVVRAEIWLTPAPQDTPVLTKYEIPFQIASDAGRVVARTSQGYLVTENSGRAWRRLAPAVSPRAGAYGDMPAFDVGGTLTVSAVIDDPAGCERVTFRRSGQRPHLARAPDCVAQLAVGDDRRTLLVTTDFGSEGYQPPKPLYISRDDGRTWKRLSLMPNGLSMPNALAADGDIVVSLWATTRPLVISRDSGATWVRLAVPDDDCLSADVRGREIWIACDRRVYHTLDAGHSWRGWDLPNVDLKGSPETAGLIVDSIVAIGPNRAMLATVGTSVLVTSDGGSHWRQRWPVLATR